MMKKPFDNNQCKPALKEYFSNLNKFEQTLEDYALGSLMEKNDPSEKMSLSEAQVAYSQLKKSSLK